MSKWADVVLFVAGLSSLLISLGVIYRYLIRPARVAYDKLRTQYDWIEDQIAARNGEGKLRDQVTRIEQRQEITGQAFEYVIGEVHDLRRLVAVNAAAIAELRTTIDEMTVTTRHTNTLTAQVDEKITEVIAATQTQP